MPYFPGRINIGRRPNLSAVKVITVMFEQLAVVGFLSHARDFAKARFILYRLISAFCAVGFVYFMAVLFTVSICRYRLAIMDGFLLGSAGPGPCRRVRKGF